MRFWYLLLWAIAAYLLPLNAAGQADLTMSSGVELANVTHSLDHQPLAFTKNMGQWPDSILFRASAGGATMWFVRDGIYYQFTRRIASNLRGEEALAAGLGPRQALPGKFNQEPDSIETDMVKAQFLSANPHVEVTGLEQQEYKCNYFLGNDPAKWHTDVPNYSAVTIKEIYPGVEATFRGNNGTLEYELRGSAEKVAKVKIGYGRPVTEEDNLAVVKTKVGEKRFHGLLPASSESVTVRATTSGTNMTLVYSTLLGGSGGDLGRGIAVDGSGSAYLTGYTNSTDFPTEAPYQTDPDGVTWDVFVAKLLPGGNGLLYSTYLGGSGDDLGRGIAVDGSGSAYVSGYTRSTNFPTQTPYQTDPGGGYNDVFVTKLSPSGSSLVYSTYLGGSNWDEGHGIAVDGQGNAYVTGYTTSTNFPTQNPYQTDPSDAAPDAFVTKLSPGGNSLVYSTYLGGSGDDQADGIAVDGQGNSYVTGNTLSTDFPTQAPFQTDPDAYPYQDAFVTKLSPGGNNLVYSTYLGGNHVDVGYSIAVDHSGSAYVTGLTASSDFPTQSPYQTYQGGMGYEDAFVTKLSPGGNTLVYSTYVGGSDRDQGQGIAVDGSGSAYVTGITWSTNFPTEMAYQTDPGDGFEDAFVSILSPVGNNLNYSTYLGGGDKDQGFGIAVDGQGNAYVAGNTLSTDFPVSMSHQLSFGGGNYYGDAFVAKLVGPCVKPLLSCTGDTLTCDRTVALATVQVTNGGDIGTFSYVWYPAPISGQGTCCPSYDAAGLKKVIVTTAAQCIDSCEVMIEESFIGPYIIATGDTLTCDSEYASAKVTVLNEGDLGPLTYFWDPPPIIGQGTNHARYRSDGWKEVIVTNLSNRCVSMTSTYIAFDNSKPDADNDGLGDRCDNCPLTANVTQTDLNHDGIGDVCQGRAAVTQAGSDVTATPVPGVTLVFASVSASGVTEVQQDNAGAPPPSGFTVYPTISPCWYQIQTSAHVSGPITICFHYNEATLTTPEDQLKIYHYDGGWIDITSSRDPVGNNICGTTTGLSPFILVEPSCCTGTTGNVNMAGIVDLSDLSLLIAYLTASPRPTLPCPAEANVNAIGIVDLSDLSLLIAYLTATPRPTLPNCP